MTHVRDNFNHLYLSFVWEGGPISAMLVLFFFFFNRRAYHAKMRSLFNAHLEGMEGTPNQGLILNSVSGQI